MKIYRFLIVALLGLTFVFTGCEETLQELNENPNEPEEVSPGVLMTAATRSSMNSMVTESFLLSNNIAQYTAKTLRTEVDVYNWNAFSTYWTAQYQALADFEDAARRAADNSDAATEGAAIVMKSWIYSSLTMAYGDIPYREAIKGVTDDNFTPGYDSQESILDGDGGVLDELERAANLLAQAATDGESVGGDIIFGGDATKWQKLANALRLRILLHLSNKRNVDQEMQDLLNSSLLMSSNDDNAVLDYLGSFPNDYPLFPLKQGDFDAVVMSESAVNLMRSYDDPRLGRYARPDNIDTLETADSPSAVYSGANNGSENAAVCIKAGSRLGLRYYDYPGHVTGNERANGIIMTYAEQLLILAEAAQKGLIGGTPGGYYRDGIEASMNYYNVSLSSFGWTDFDDFYNNSGVAFNNDLNQIWEQKWLAVFFHGMEPFFEVRRMVYETNNGTSFDVATVPFLNAPCQNVNNDELPIRYLYPGNEQSLNAENYQSAVDDLGGSNSQNARMWIMTQ